MRALFALLLCAAAFAAHAQDRVLRLDGGRELHYRLIEPGAHGSALPVAREVLRRLSAADIVEAAALSNSPLRRHQVLQEYLLNVGEEEFKRVFSRYAESRLVAEVAIGPRRLLIWNLSGGAGDELAGQYYVEIDGRFRLDDVPSEARMDLKRVLLAYRREARSSARKD